MYIPTHLEAFWWYRYYEIANKSDVIDYIFECQNSNGGIANYINGTDYLETTFFAIVALTILNAPQTINHKTLSYIKLKENSEGGFGESSSNKPNLFNTFYATICLKLTENLEPDIRERTINYINKFIIHQDGFYELHNGYPSTTALYWALLTLKTLSVDIFEYKECITTFLFNCYHKGLFSPTPDGMPTIQNTFESLVILKELSSVGIFNVNEIFDSIISRKKEALYYDDLLKMHTISSSMWAVSSLNIIGMLDRFNNFDLLHFVSELLVKKNSLYDIYCSINIISNMLYEVGQINLKKHNVLSENGYSKSIDIINDISLKLLKSGLEVSTYDFMYKCKQYTIDTQLYCNFVQIILSDDDFRIYEVEFVDNKPFSLINALSRVSKECISIRLIPRDRLKMLGIFNPTKDLIYSEDEIKIVRDYCKNNLILSFNLISGDDAKYKNILNAITNQYHIFYYSGHSQESCIFTNDQKILIEDLLLTLYNNNCFVAFFNSCNTYADVKKFYLNHPAISDNFNVICCISDISDDLGKWFLIYFLYYFELGIPISESLRLAKKDLFLISKSLGSSWWSYILFGNPYTVIC